MKEIIKTKSKIVVMICAIAAALLFTQNVQAATKQEKAAWKKAKTAYGKFLEKNQQKYPYFQILNIGTKNEPILVVSNYARASEGNTTGFVKLFYYTGKGVKAVKGSEWYCGDSWSSIKYINKSLFVPNRWGLGYMLKVKKGQTTGTAVYLKYVSNATKERYYKATVKVNKLKNAKRISKKTFKKYIKKWKYNSKKDYSIHMKENNLQNRSKYTGVKGW